MTRVAGHGTIQPLQNPDGTVTPICAKSGCDKMVQPWGRDESGTLIWRHVAPGRKFSGESKWIKRQGDGFVDSGFATG